MLGYFITLPRSPSLLTIYHTSATIVGECCGSEYEYTIPFDLAIASIEIRNLAFRGVYIYTCYPLDVFHLRIYRGISGCVLNSIANSQSLENLY